MIDMIHIGDYKTGTSWLQKFYFSSHPDLHYLDSGRDQRIIRLMHRLVDERDLDFDAISLRSEFAKVIKDANIEHKKVAISREALSGLYPRGEHAKRNAERLFSVFGSTKVLIVIREPFSMLASIYSQYVKMGGTLSMKAFVFDPVVSPGLIERLKYAKMIDAYVKIFGGENVLTVLFDEFEADNQHFGQRVSGFIGCSSEWSPPLFHQPANPSLTRAGLEVQRIINRFLRNEMNPGMPLIPFDAVLAQIVGPRVKERLINSVRTRLVYSQPGKDDPYVLRYAINSAATLYISKLCERIRWGRKIAVPDIIVRQLSEEFSPSNRILRDKYHLPVEKFGWSL